MRNVSGSKGQARRVRLRGSWRLLRVSVGEPPNQAIAGVARTRRGRRRSALAHRVLTPLTKRVPSPLAPRLPNPGLATLPPPIRTFQALQHPPRSQRIASIRPIPIPSNRLEPNTAILCRLSRSMGYSPYSPPPPVPTRILRTAHRGNHPERRAALVHLSECHTSRCRPFHADPVRHPERGGAHGQPPRRVQSLSGHPALPPQGTRTVSLERGDSPNRSEARGVRGRVAA